MWRKMLVYIFFVLIGKNIQIFAYSKWGKNDFIPVMLDYIKPSVSSGS